MSDPAKPGTARSGADTTAIGETDSSANVSSREPVDSASHKAEETPTYKPDVTHKPLLVHDVTALILAGGRGSRLGGVDKGLVSLHGRPFIEWVLDVIRPYADRVLISANRHQDQYKDYGTVIADDAQLGASQGPLAGLLAAAPHVNTGWLVVAACDMPLLPEDYVPRLYEALMNQGGQVAFVHAGARDHSVCLLMHASVLDTLGDYLQSGRRAVLPWLEAQQALRVVFDDADAFVNVNTQEDLTQVQARNTRD